MSKYPNLSLFYQKQINESTVQSMQMIGKLDASAESLSQILEEKLKILNENIELNKDELEEIQMIRKVLEVIAAKKVELAIKSYDMIDLTVKAIDTELNLLEKAIRKDGIPLPTDVTNEEDDRSEAGGVRKKRSLTFEEEESEPVYCLCKQVAYGEMIACDNEDCPIEWFHYSCVNLTRKPRNSWICPICSNRRKR
jgi:hypothetical protein